ELLRIRLGHCDILPGRLSASQVRCHLILQQSPHIVRLENLDTSNGPDLHVWLTDAPVKKGVAGWRVFDDGMHVSLGKLKGNKGSQNYALPRDVDPSSYNSVSIWCDRFDVSFGAAELARV
ncbi:DM13 domain-containing protein, partial [Streptomyces sp. NPDC020597]|uniref:DM13 domain-containing protein n=1 Tax=unclassified Streptomyces TaxID=2593676 RepID=UPI0037AE116F